MEHSDVTKMAERLGFARVYYTKPMRFNFDPENEYNLVMDAVSAYPFAASIAVLVYPYEPFHSSTRIPSYYPASNHAYHSIKGLIELLEENGIHAEKANIPVKPQLLSSGIGIQCRNSLVSIPPFGTRMVLLALAIDSLGPLEYNEPDVPCSEICGSIGACSRVCPVQAIGEKGILRGKCMRAEMDSAIHPDHVKKHMCTYIGCEICQYACPRNSGLGGKEPPQELKLAFDTSKLISGDTAEARKLVGKNMTSNGKLTAEAIAMASVNEPNFFEKYEQELAEAESSQFPSVHDALRFANEIRKN